jgi:hypothetical protein
MIPIAMHRNLQGITKQYLFYLYIILVDFHFFNLYFNFSLAFLNYSISVKNDPKDGSLYILTNYG